MDSVTPPSEMLFVPFAAPVIAAAARPKLTAGDIEFEPRQPKIWPITNSIVAMYSGDAAIQTEILRFVELDVNVKLKKDPNAWLNVSYVAGLYREHYRGALLRRAEDIVLAPLGLNLDSFLSRQRELDPSLVRDLASRLENYSFGSQAAIFAGIDLDGPQPDTVPLTYAHIYVAHDSNLTCQDRVGFGSYWHWAVSRRISLYV